MKRGGERGQEIKNLQVEMKEILAWLMGREKQPTEEMGGQYCTEILGGIGHHKTCQQQNEYDRCNPHRCSSWPSFIQGSENEASHYGTKKRAVSLWDKAVGFIESWEWQGNGIQ
jgi:hypothetical protein